jgi:hypothetical protein
MEEPVRPTERPASLLVRLLRQRTEPESIVPGSPATTRDRFIRAASWVGWFAFAVSLAFLIDGPRIRWTHWEVLPNGNKNFLEALAWHQGRLDVPAYSGDLAVFQGRFYNVFPPLFTFLSYLAIGLHRLFGGGPGFGPWLFRLGLGLPVALAAYRAGSNTEVNHALSVVGTLLLAGDLLGRRRTPVTCLCVIWSIWYFHFIT